MYFRVTQQQIAASARSAIARQSVNLHRAQRQITSGLRVERPSDDPTAMRRGLIQRDRLTRLGANATSLQHVRSRAEQAHVSLREANDLLVKASSLAIQAQQAVEPTESRILAAEVERLLSRLTGIANSSDESGYLFGATADGSPPFSFDPDQPGLATYSGADSPTQLLLSGMTPTDALLPGDRIFQPSERGPTIIVGTSGVQPGTGTDSAEGRRQLQVAHTATTYAGGSGIAPGASSPTGDTVIGQTGTHVLTIVDTSGTGAAGTVSLNGGTEVPFTSGDTNLEVTAADGTRVFVDTTAITPGFSGDVDITASGTLSIDGGATTTPITFSANQIVTDSRDGSFVTLDTTGAVRAATDSLEFPGTADVFRTLQSFRDDLLNLRELPPDELQAALNRGLGEIQRVQEHVLDMIGVQSVSLEHFEQLRVQVEDLEVAEEIELTDTVGADVTEAIFALQETQNLQQFTMAAVGRLLTPSLLEFLR